MNETETWTRERIELIKRTVVPQGIPDAEFALFIEQCRRSGLDPLLKQAFCVKRKQNIGSRERPQWVDKYEFQPAETGLLARAEGMPDFAGISASAVCAHDDVLIDAGGGEVHHSYSPVGQRGPLLGAWARVERRGRLPVIVWLDVGAYSQQTATWTRMPATMIEKCARVAALRKAYPSAFGGLYIKEEMPEEESSPAYVLEREVAPPPPLAAQLPTAAVSGAIGVPVQSRIPARLASVAAPPPTPAPKPRRTAKAPPAPPSAVTAPWTRIKTLAAQHGIADTALFQALREATGKVSPGKMTPDDVARFEAYVSARGGGANVQAETEAPGDDAPPVERPPGEEEDPAGEIPF